MPFVPYPGQYTSACGDNGVQPTTTNCKSIANWQYNVQTCYCNTDLCNPAGRSMPASVSVVVAMALVTAFAALKWH
jgi:hypothetical protein